MYIFVKPSAIALGVSIAISLGGSSAVSLGGPRSIIYVVVIRVTLMTKDLNSPWDG